MDIDGLFNSILNDIISKAKRDREVTLTIIEDVGDAKNFNAIFHPYVRVAKVSADSYLIAKTLHDSFTFHSVLGKGHILYSSRVVLAPGSHCFTFTFDGKKHHLNYKHELSILS